MSDCCSVNAKIGAAPAVMACPVNGARSKQVDMLTVKSLVRQLPLRMPDTQLAHGEIDRGGADCGGSRGRPLCLRSEKSYWEMLLR